MSCEVVRLDSRKKKCTVCELEKYLDQFDKHSGNKTDGRRGMCKKCNKDSREEYINSNRDRMRLRDREKYANLSEEDKKIYINKKVESNNRRLKYKPEVKKKYDKSDRGIYARYRLDSNRRGRNYAFDLTFTQFSALVNSPCKYCGVSPSRGVDRVINEIGYTVENSASCCGRCNEMKNSFSVVEWLDKMEQILKCMGRI